MKDTLRRLERNVDFFLNSVVQIEPGDVLENFWKMKSEDCTFSYKKINGELEILHGCSEVTFKHGRFGTFEIKHSSLNKDRTVTVTVITKGQMSEKDSTRLKAATSLTTKKMSAEDSETLEAAKHDEYILGIGIERNQVYISKQNTLDTEDSETWIGYVSTTSLHKDAEF